MKTRASTALGSLLLALVLGSCGGGDAGGDAGGGGHRAAPAPVQTTARPAYVGMVASEALPQPRAEQEATLEAQAAAGVGLLRQTFQWNEIEPRQGEYAFGMHDQLVASAARAGIELLPVVFNVRPGEGARAAPGARITPTTTMPPRDPAAFAAYATVLVKRYGRGGTFWKDHPELPPHPMTAWQVWNEPNLPAYWGGRPKASAYVDLLAKTGAAIRAVDPRAEIVTGGIPDSKLGVSLRGYVSAMAKAGAKGTFDTLAIHPYARSVDGVISGSEDARSVLDRAGLQDAGLWITEVGWATGGPHSAFTVSRQRQGELVAELLGRTATVAPALRLRGVVYFGWRDAAPYPGGKDFWGLHTGLVTRAGAQKPALGDFAAAARALRHPSS